LKEYEVEITETLQMTVTVEANSAAEAERLVKAAYDNSEYILDADHFMGADIRTIEDVPERIGKPSVLDSLNALKEKTAAKPSDKPKTQENSL